jgi:hypothetical protein
MRRVIRRIGPPALLLAAAILLWQGVASLHGVDNLTLASPVETWQALRHDRSLLFDQAGVTAVEVVLGLLISIVLGFGLAVVMHLMRPLRDAAYPFAVGVAGDPDRRACAALHPRVRLRHRPEAGDRRADLLLPDRRQRPRRAAIGRPLSC